MNCDGDKYSLNESCGADYLEKVPTQSVLWASLDGDAHRLVVYLCDEDDNSILADGDRIAVLCAQET